MSVYTGNGDQGQTDLFSGERVKKYDIQVEAYGAVDEVNSHLGRARSQIEDEQISGIISEVQHKLFTLGAELASRQKEVETKITAEDVNSLEEKIDFFQQKVDLQKGFSIPGDSEIGSTLDLARTVTRRAERRIVELSEEDYQLNEAVAQYINRLSDLLFVLRIVEDSK